VVYIYMMMMIINSLDEVFAISEVFEDVSKILQSQKYIDFLHGLQLKYPNANLSHSIQVVKDFYIQE